jgi:rfaE bifunctional protein kinase chain/domain
MDELAYRTAIAMLTTEGLDNIFDSFAGKRVLVIGDVMIDSYWWGRVDRISPEAPVPVVNIKKRENRLGGAANVALNLKKLGAEPIICSAIGNDPEGGLFRSLLKEQHIGEAGLIETVKPTTTKMRIIGNNSQMLRIDSEEDEVLTSQDQDVLMERILSLISDSDVIIFEDYDKGLITAEIIEKTIRTAESLGIPVVVDPKKRNFIHYRNATIFKPNLRELADGLKIDIEDFNDLLELEESASKLRKEINAKCILITLSERGVMECTDKQTEVLPAHVRNIYDVSGAGDTVVSVAALSLLSGTDWNTIAALANLAGGLVCEKPGVVPLTLQELRSEALNVLCLK